MTETKMKKLPTLDEKVYNAIKENPTATREEVAQIVGITLQRARERIAVLKKKGMLSEVKVLVPLNREVDILVKGWDNDE